MGVIAKHDVRALEKITQSIHQAVEKSREQMVEIYEAARAEWEMLQRDLDKVKSAIAEVQNELSRLEEKERKERMRLVAVSRNFHLYTEEQIREAYEQAQTLQVEMALARARERGLRLQQDTVGTRLKGLASTLEKAGTMVNQAGLVLGFMGDEMNNVCSTIETLQQSQDFGARIIRAQEEERRRVARDIHDGPAQIMANIVFRVEVCERLLNVDTARVRTEMADLKEQVRGCLKEIRNIIFDLRPMTLDDLGLVATAQRVLSAVQERTGMNVELRVRGAEKRLEGTVEIGLFRLLQEAVQNVEKHAKATRLVVTVEFMADQVVITVEDDGRGFDPDAISGEHFGLIGMRERVTLLRGEFDLQTTPGAGTRLRFLVPVLG